MSSGETINRLKLTASQNRKLVDLLDAKAPPLEGSDKRRSARYPYLVPEGLSVEVEQPGGTRYRFLIRPRNISERGLSFFHSSFMHRDTLCRFALRTRGGETQPAAARVVHCRHVVGEVHEVGARFARPIDLTPFIEGRSPADAAPSARLLCVDDAADEVAALRQTAADAGIDFVHANDAVAAIDGVTQAPFDLILVGDRFASMTPDELVEVLGEEGHRDRLVRWTDSPDTVVDGLPTLERAVTAEALLERLGRVAPASLPSTAGLVSENWGDPRMRPAILGYLESLEEQTMRLQHHLDEMDRDALASMLREVAASGASQGFPALAEAAGRGVAAAQQDDVEALRQVTAELIELCHDACGFRAKLQYEPVA